jgi:hypothetical protein
VGEINKIPEYSKEIRDKFRYHYWIVWHEYKEMKIHIFFIYPRFRWLKHPIDPSIEMCFDELSSSLNPEIPLIGSIVKELKDYREWGRKGCWREITVAELKKSVKTLNPKWGLGIYKPNDVVNIYKKTPNYVVGPTAGGGMAVHHLNPPFTMEKIGEKRVNFTKKLGQAWAIKDFERKHGEVKSDG